MISPIEEGPRSLTRRRFLGRSAQALGLAALVPAASLLAEGFTDASSAATSTTSLGSIRFQFDWITNIQFGGSFIAQSKGYYRDEGINVSLVTGGPNVSVIPVLVAGNALVGIVDPPTSAAANTKGADIVIIAAGYQQSPNAIISLAKDPI